MLLIETRFAADVVRQTSRHGAARRGDPVRVQHKPESSRTLDDASTA